jgi:hypothetical protein
LARRTSIREVATLAACGQLPYFWPLLILAIVDLARNGVDLVYPYRTWPRVLDGTIVVLAAITAALIATDIVRLVRR